MSVEIRADVPISIHPDALSPQAEALEAKPGSLATAQGALETAYRWIGAVNDAERALAALAQSEAPARRRQLPTGQSEFLGDLRLTRAGLRQFSGHEEELAEAAGAHMERVTKKIDAARGELIRTAETLDSAITFALTDDEAVTPRGANLAAEVRAHVKALPSKERFGFVQTAIKDGDLPTVAAIIDGSRSCLGSSPTNGAALASSPHRSSRHNPSPNARRSANSYRRSKWLDQRLLPDLQRFGALPTPPGPRPIANWRNSRKEPLDGTPER